MSSDISVLFTSFRNYLKKDQDLREEIRDVVKNIEQAGRDIVTTLQVIHTNGSLEEINLSCEQSRGIIEKDVKTGYNKLHVLLALQPVNQYYRYHDNWKFINQRMTFIVALIVYLESGTLVSIDDVADCLGSLFNQIVIRHIFYFYKFIVSSQENKGFHLDLEDYLMGLLNLCSELSRLAVNSVIYGDYKKPIQISQFVAELNAGFRLLHLKNDSLRKRFDALKYDVKKIEEVVYDLSIRGLKPNDEN